MSDADSTVLTRRIILGVFLTGLLLLGYQVLHLFLVPIAWAVILTYVTWPLYRKVNYWLTYPTGSALSMALILGAAFALPVVLLTASLRSELPAAYQAVTAYLQEGPHPLPDFIARVPWLGPQLQKFLEQLAEDQGLLNEQLATWAKPWLEEAAKILGDVGRNAIKFGIALITAFFLYRDGERLLVQIRWMLLRFLGERTRAYLEAVGDTIRGVLYGLVLTALAQGLLAGLGYAVAGVRSPVLLGALTAIVALIPFGAPVVWGSIGIVLLLDGATLAGIGILVWGALVVSQVDNLIRPLVISSATRIPFLLVMFGVFGGIAAFGLVGLFMGPVIVAVLLAVWQEWLEEEAPPDMPP